MFFLGVYQLYEKTELKQTKSSLSPKNETLTRRNIPAIRYSYIHIYVTIMQSIILYSYTNTVIYLHIYI